MLMRIQRGLAAIVLATTAACARGGLVELETNQLPGITIDLPRGTRVDRLNSYSAGQRTVRADKADAASVVQWRPGRYLDDQHFNIGITAVLLGLGSKTENVRRDVVVPLPIGIEGRSWSAEIEGRQLWSTFLACGGRHVSLLTMSRGGLARRLHRRVVASVRCQPEAAMEAALYDVPVVLDLPSGWGQTEGKNNLATIVVTDGNHLIGVNTVATRMEPQHALYAVTDLFGPTPRIASQDRGEVAIQGILDGKPVAGWLTHLECREIGKTLQLISRSNGGLAEAEVGLRLLRRARCRRGDEQPQTWARFGAARSP
jgi:hypothetical protein